MGTPLIALQTVTGSRPAQLTTAVAIQLSLFDLLIPFWLVAVFCGLAGALEVWPALLLAGGVFGLAQLLTAAPARPLAGKYRLLSGRHWARSYSSYASGNRAASTNSPGNPSRDKPADFDPALIRRAWAPWLLLSAVVFVWGLPQVKNWMDSFSLLKIPIPGLNMLVLRVPPVVPAVQPQPAVFELAWLSATEPPSSSPPLSPAYGWAIARASCSQPTLRFPPRSRLSYSPS